MTPHPTLHESPAALLAPLARSLLRRQPAILALSIHDSVGRTLWSSSDFLLAEDHALIAEVIETSVVESLSLWWESADTARARCALGIVEDGRLCGVVVAVFSGLTAGEAERGERIAELEPVLPVLARALQKLAHPRQVANAVVAELHFARAQADDGFVSDTAAPSRERHIVELIDSALRDDGFALHLQPSATFHEDDEQLIVDVRIRLPTQDFGVLSSQEFQAAAERNGRMPAIDRWIIRALLVWMRRNRDCWADVNAVFSVDLSGRSVLRPDFRVYLEQCLDKSGLPLGALRFNVGGLDVDIAPPECTELTRSLLMRGCQVSLDNTPADTGRFDFVDGNSQRPLGAEARA
jgi:hypothetical protein